MVHPTRATEVTRGVEVGNSGMKNMNLAMEIDPIFNIFWDQTSRVPHGIKEGFEL